MSSPTVLSLGQLRAIEFPPQEWVVGNLIPRGGLTGIFGREKIGKSLFAYHMGMAISMDQPFIDQDVIAGPVLFFPAEENLREVQERLVALAGKHDPPAYVFPIGGEYRQDLRLDHLESWERAESAIKQTGATTAFIDPLRETHGGSENDADEMAPLLKPVRQCAHDTNTAIAFIHHAGKAGSARGSTAIAAACDQIIELTSLNEDEDLTSTRLRIVAYGRYGPRKVLYARLGDNFRWSLTDAPVVMESSSTRQRILDWICNGAQPQTANDIADALSLSKKTVQNLISELLDQNPPRIVATGRGVTGDPRRYQGVHQHLFDDGTIPETENPRGNHFGNSPQPTVPDTSGNIGNTEESRRCTDCGAPLEAHRRYRCDACVTKSLARSEQQYQLNGRQHEHL